jgi:hypothetical protein
MAKKNSGLLVTLGVLHLVGGGLGLIVTTCSGVGLAVNQAARPTLAAGDLGSQIRGHLIGTVPGFEAVEFAGVAVGLLFDLALLAGGIGLLLRQAWARYLSLGYAVLSILWKLFFFGYYALVVYPPMKAFLDQQAANMPPAQQAGFSFGVTFGFFGAVCFQSLFIAYPIVVLCLLLRPSAARLFEPAGDGRRYREDEWEEDEDDYR